MPHIHTEPGQHDFTASAFIFRFVGKEPKILLHMHKTIGKLMQPGGHIELGENPWQAIAHEVDEETGYVLNDLKVLQPDWALKNLPESTVHPLPFCVNTHDFPGLDHKHIDLSYVFLAKNLPSKAPDIASGESSDLRWLSQKEIAGLTDSQIPVGVKEIALRAFEVSLRHWKPITVTDFEL